MSETKTQITAKVNKGIRDFSGIISKDLKPYEGKIVTFKILDVHEITVTEKPGATITETKKVQVTA